MPTERRPADHEYYEERLPLFSQGDIFDDVPLSYPLPAREIATDEGAGERKSLSGPLEFGKAMLITPTCSMRAQAAAGYAHPVRTLVPIMPLDEGLISHLGLNEEKLGFLRSYDGLINYMYHAARTRQLHQDEPSYHRAALRGLDKGRRQREWSDAAILTAIRDFRDRTRRWPGQHEFRSSNGLPGVGTVLRRYGSHVRAVRRAKMSAAADSTSPSHRER